MAEGSPEFGDVHPGIKHFEQGFRWGHLQDTRLQTLSRSFATQAERVVFELANYLQADQWTSTHTEIAAGLRKLLEAKDSIVRGYSFITNPT